MTLAALAGLALATLVSEDLATIGAAELARAGVVPAAAAVVACGVGIYAGDLVVFVAGRMLGPRLLRCRVVARVCEAAAVEQFALRLDAKLGVAVLTSRLLPGARLPTYLAAGIWGRRPLAFAAWAFVAVSIWTPVLFATSLAVGDVLAWWLAGTGRVVQHALAATAVVALLHAAGRRARARHRVSA